MAGSGYWEAVQCFVDDLQAAVYRVTPAILRAYGPFSFAESIGRLALSEPIARLNGGNGRCGLSLAMRFRVAPAASKEDRWEIQTFAYVYQLYLDDREIIAYHWDHEGASTGGVTIPHAHFGKELPHPTMSREDREAIGSIAAAHMPTGLVSFTDVLRMVTRDFGVELNRLQGETIDDALVGVDRALSTAEAALQASFDWVGRRSSQ